MDSVHLALALLRAAVLQEANSARPWAPVVPARPPHRPYARRGRRVLASALHRVADAVTPAPVRNICSPAH